MTKRFKITSEMPEGWVDIIDTDNNQTLCNIRIEYADNMIKLLNELHEKNQDLLLDCDTLKYFYQGMIEQLRESNEKVIMLMNEAIIEALDGARYNVVDLLEKAIEELKK